MRSPVNVSYLPDYRAVWRWHFYAGLFTIPFVLILSITGGIYLFKPQIERWQDRPYDDVGLASSLKPISEQIRAAVAAVPTSQFESFELPPTVLDAGRVTVTCHGESNRCYVNPSTLKVMNQVAINGQFISVVKQLHGELLLGQNGSHVVELAACWTIVMIITGLYLWWPRNVKGFAGVLYPRLLSGGKRFWRDFHSVTGFWVSACALILILTGLPWAAFWGDYFKAIRVWTGTSVAKQDWVVGNETKMSGTNASSSTIASSSYAPLSSNKEGHGEHQQHAAPGGWARSTNAEYDLNEIDRVIATVRPLALPTPVIVSPPSKPNGDWSVKSMTGNRPLRVTLAINGASGEITSREVFQDRHVIDRIVGTGIALHEGQLFGWLNQAIGLLTVLGLMLLSSSGVVLWWRRRHVGLLGAPKAVPAHGRSPALIGAIVALAIYLPIFGASLAAVLLLERWVLRRLPRVNAWLGIEPS